MTSWYDDDHRDPEAPAWLELFLIGLAACGFALIFFFLGGYA